MVSIENFSNIYDYKHINYLFKHLVQILIWNFHLSNNLLIKGLGGDFSDDTIHRFCQFLIMNVEIDLAAQELHFISNDIFLHT